MLVNPAELLTKTWAIQPEYARSMYPYLLMMLKGSRSVHFGEGVVTDHRDLSVARAAGKPVIAVKKPVSAQGSFEITDTATIADAPAGSVAVLPISGAIMKDDSLSSYGTATKGKWLQQAYDNPNITGVVLKINSGGGDVDGTMAMANLVKRRNKPVLAFVDGMAASAAYWIAMNADAILMNDATSQVGSIGVMMTFVDDRKYWENMGISFTDILATGSEDKNKGYFDAKKGKYTTIKDESLNPLREMFAQAVIDARGGKIDLEQENVLSGKMYFAAATAAGNKSAIDVGLADGYGTLEDAISRVLQLSTTRKYKQNSFL